MCFNSFLIVLTKTMMIKLPKMISKHFFNIKILSIINILSSQIFYQKSTNLNSSKIKPFLTSNNSDPTLINFIFLFGQHTSFNKLLETKLLGKVLGINCTQRLKKENTKSKTIRKKKRDLSKSCKF